MKKIKKITTVLLVCLFLSMAVPVGAAHKQATQGTKEEARAMVEKAAEWFKKYGREKTLAEITRGGTEKKGEFKDRDLYIFAGDFIGTCLAHGENPKLIGNNFYDWQDVDGRYNIRALIDFVSKKGSGWSPVYKWTNPETNTIEPKLTYVKKIDETLWIGCGVYGKEAQLLVKKRIGILEAFQQARFDEARQGVLDQLAQDGYKKPVATFFIENAQGSHVKAADLVPKLAAAKLDLLITLGTVATVAAVKGIQDVPIIFGVVYDPVESGIAKNWSSSGNNSTGVSNKVPMSNLLSSLKSFAPVKKLAVLFTPGQKNSELQLADLRALQTGSGIKIVPVPVTSRNDVHQVLPEVVHTADAIYLTGSVFVGETIAYIADMANKAKVVTITHNDDLVEKGALLGVCANSYSVGRLVGKKAVQVLHGAKPSSLPIDIPKKTDLLINMKSAKAGQFTIPPAFMKKVTRVIE